MHGGADDKKVGPTMNFLYTMLQIIGPQCICYAEAIITFENETHCMHITCEDV